MNCNTLMAAAAMIAATSGGPGLAVQPFSLPRILSTPYSDLPFFRPKTRGRSKAKKATTKAQRAARKRRRK